MNKLKAKHYVGYTLVDFANNLAFCVMSSYLAIYCTDILGIAGGVVSAIMIAARIWDAVNDPIMGFIIQSKKPNKYGKYRPFILYGGYPLAVSALLVFLKISNSLTVNTIWVAAAYILYGMIYTILSVPYGSLATVMTTRDNERSILSMCRAVGGGFGNLPTLIFPMLIMTAGADGNQMDADKLRIGMVIIAVSMIVLYTISFKLTTERVVIKEEQEKVSMIKTIRLLIKDRAFVTMSIIGCLILAVQMYLSTVNLYLFKDYFHRSGMNTVYMIVSYAPMALMIPFANMLIKKFGKKEVCIVSLAISAVAAFLTFILQLGEGSITLFIVLAFFINAGIGFLVLEVWSMAADIIDYHEWKTNKREEAATFALFTFMRKIGQAIAALAPFFVSLVGYDASKVGTGIAQSEHVLKSMYNVATLVPFIMIALMLILSIIYPLNKKTTEQMHSVLEEKRAHENAKMV